MTTDAYTALSDTLAFWHPTLDRALDDDHLDWGQVGPGSSADRQVRVRNLSDDYTAVAVTVTCGEPERAEDVTVPPTGAQHYLSADGTGFAATAALGDLDPGQTSGVVTVRRVTDPGAQPGPARFLLTAGPAVWAPAASQGGGLIDDAGEPDELPVGEEE